MTNGELRGVIHGRTIVLDEEPGLPDGAAVAVRVSEATATKDGHMAPGEGLRRAAGAWKDDDEKGLDEYLRWCREQRQAVSREIDA
jgi:hypothetical protein